MLFLLKRMLLIRNTYYKYTAVYYKKMLMYMRNKYSDDIIKIVIMITFKSDCVYCSF